MINILQFKLGGEYEYNVTYETGYEKRKIQTNEEPKNELVSITANVCNTAIKYFRLNNIAASFKQITFSYPENGFPAFVIELYIKAIANVYIKHTLKSDKLLLSSEDVIGENDDYQSRIIEKNSLVEKIISLREEVVSYVQGARNQNELPFDEEEEG